MIRAARVDDVELLAEIERRAGERFREIGMDAVADDEAFPVGEVLGYQRAGRAWVATDDLDRPIAYLLVDLVDGAAHIEQVSVRPDHAGRGVGRSLIETAAEWAGQRGLTALTLTTFADVPWNAPYYTRLGFSVVEGDALTAGLRRIRDHEAALWPDAWPRVVMRRAVGPTVSGRQAAG